MGHNVRFIMESRVCSSSSKTDNPTKLEAENTGSACAATPAKSSSSTNVLVHKEDETTEEFLLQAPDVARFACMVSPDTGSPVFNSEYESKDPALDTEAEKLGEVEAKVLLSLSDKRNKGLSQSQEVIPSVPNIVVEHVLAKGSHSHCMTTPFVVPSALNLAASSGFRQIRALSDSSVHELNASYIPSGSSEFRHLQPNTWKSLSNVDETGWLRNESDLQVEFNLRTGLRRCKISRLSAVIEPDQGDVETLEHVHSDSSAIASSPQCHFHSYQGHFSQGKSPKTYWLRRHSDSNLATPPCLSLRPEPYPIRSRSTGDSVQAAVAHCETASAVEDEVPIKMASMDEESKGATDSSESCDEKSTGLYEKRLKLKKYLQTRYQTSLREMRQSSDADDVFICSPTLVDSPEPVKMHIGISLASPSSASSSLETMESKSRRQFFSHQRQRQGMKSMGKKELSSENIGRSSHETSEPGYYSEIQSSMAMEESLSPVCTCSTELPLFVFPISSKSDPSVDLSISNPCSQNLVSSGLMAPGLEAESLILTTTSPSRLNVSETRSVPEISSQQEPRDTHHSYQVVPSKQRELLGTSSNFPMLVDLPAEKLTQRGYPQQCHKWEFSDRPTHMLAMTRPQSYNSLSPYSPISEQSNYQLARFPSMPLLSDTSSSATVSCWQDFGEVAPLFVSNPVVRLASTSSDKSFEMKPVYSHLQECGLDQEDTVLTQSQFTCPLCSQEFASYNRLANHMSGHLPNECASKDNSTEGMKVHICRICNRGFARSDMLTRHTRLHTGLRPYECHLCGQVFSRSDHLHTHLRTHTGEKPYKCTYCPYAAPRRDMVTRHLRIHTRDVLRRGRRSSSVSSEVLTSSIYSDLPAKEATRRMPSLTSFESTRSGHDFSGCSVDTSDTELAHVQHVVSCRTCSLTSCESTEGSDVSHAFPVCRAWSNTSTESFESFSSPGMRERLSWSSSADSPDVFSQNHHQFFWSVRPSYSKPEKVSASSVAVDALSFEMQTSFERCTVTTPEHKAGEKKRRAKDKTQDFKIKMERKFDSEGD